VKTPRQLVWSVSGACPEGWQYYENSPSCFYVSTIQRDQADARADCQSMDADLASVGDQMEMDFVIGIS